MSRSFKPFKKLAKIGNNIKDQVYSTASKLAKAEDNLNKKITHAVGLDTKLTAKSKQQHPRKKNNNRKSRSSGGLIQPAGSNRIQQPILVRRREFITNILGTTTPTGFDTRVKESISASNHYLFPWGSQVLPNYEMYRLKSLHFHFISSTGNVSSTGSLGNIVLGVTYDADDPPLTTYSDMLNYSGFKSVKISNNLSVSVTTKNNPLPVRYVHHGDGEIDLSDYGTFYCAVEGNPSDGVVGALWVEYAIEMYVPRPNTSPQTQMFSSKTTKPTGAYQGLTALSTGDSTSHGGANFGTIDLIGGVLRFKFRHAGLFQIKWTEFMQTSSGTPTVASTNPSIGLGPGGFVPAEPVDYCSNLIAASSMASFAVMSATFYLDTKNFQNTVVIFNHSFNTAGAGTYLNILSSLYICRYYPTVTVSTVASKLTDQAIELAVQRYLERSSKDEISSPGHRGLTTVKDTELDDEPQFQDVDTRHLVSKRLNRSASHK